MNQLTIFYYANGNNELNPDIFDSFLKLKAHCFPDNVQIIVQISRCSMEMVQLIRPQEPSFYTTSFEKNDCWVGTRRYLITKGAVHCIGILEDINMAAPSTFHDFLDWGLKNYPGKHYGLLVGGHSYPYVGLSPDFTQEKPYLLGFLELSWSIYLACIKYHMEFDFLILDTCYASSYETIYEFSRFQTPIIKYLLTYTQSGPVGRFPYVHFIDYITNYIDDNLEHALKDYPNLLLTQMHFKSPIMILKLNYKLICLCKEQFHNIATYILREIKHTNYEESIEYYLNTTDTTKIWYPHLLYLHRISKKLILVFSDTQENSSNYWLLQIQNKRPLDKLQKHFYEQLHFSMDNEWCNLICNLPPKTTLQYFERSLLPIELTHQQLYTWIENTNQLPSIEKMDKLTEDLVAYNHWIFPNEKGGPTCL